MPRPVRCPKCGLVQMGQESCKKCGAALGAPIPGPIRTAPARAEERSPYQPPDAPSPSALSKRPQDASLDAVFERDRFLMRQRVFTINEKYEIWDEQGSPILFVERPAHHLRNLGAALGGLIAGGVVAAPFFWLSSSFATGFFIFVGVVLWVAALVLVGSFLSKKRHVHFYRDESKQEPLLAVRQDRKLVFLTHTYTVEEPSGRPLARFSKNMLTDVFRKKWRVSAPDGRLLWEAKEDSVLLALVRRFLTRLVPLCFIFCLPGGQVVAEFNRKFTILDRYVLDLSKDVARALDRRVALAMGVMLDTGERR